MQFSELFQLVLQFNWLSFSGYHSKGIPLKKFMQNYKLKAFPGWRQVTMHASMCGDSLENIVFHNPKLWQHFVGWINEDFK